MYFNDKTNKILHVRNQIEHFLWLYFITTINNIVLKINKKINKF